MLKSIAPNRIAVYLTAAAALAGALAPVVGDLDLSSTVGIVGALGVLGHVVGRWLAGWHIYEQAIYRRQIIETEHAAVLEQQAAAVEAQRAVSKPGLRPGVQLPR